MKVYQPHHAHLAPGSIGDSILKIPEYVKKAKQYGLKYPTMTDHVNLSAMYTFYAECRKNNIMPIIGIEMYEVPNRLEKNSQAREYNEETLNRLCFERLNDKLPFVANPAEYVERLLYELDVIKLLGFGGYFLIVYDFINYAGSRGIAVRPGRGSASPQEHTRRGRRLR